MAKASKTTARRPATKPKKSSKAAKLSDWALSKGVLERDVSGLIFREDDQYGVHWMAHDLPLAGDDRRLSVILIVRPHERATLAMWIAEATSDKPHGLIALDLHGTATPMQSVEGAATARMIRVADDWTRIEYSIQLPPSMKSAKLMLAPRLSPDSSNAYQGSTRRAFDIADALTVV